MNSNTVYITGHRNPDMDSLCSAMGYAALKNLIDPRREYIPVRCSRLGDGVKRLFGILGETPPVYMPNVYPKVADVMITAEEKLDASATLGELAARYRGIDPPALPVFEGEDYCGLISLDAIADWTMKTLREGGDLRNTPAVRDVMLQPQTKPVRTDDLYEDVKKKLQKSPHRGIAVFDREGVFAGYVTHSCFLDTPRYNVILVDHNEPEQSVKGIETANVCEIIDHHRLNALKTDLPLFIDAEPLGSTCTIVYQMYLQHGIRPDRHTAKLLLTGLITDTLILKSPTTTRVDIDSADALAAISGLEVDEFGKQLFSCVEELKTRAPEEAIVSDFKRYKEKNMRIGIGQCEVTTLKDIDEYAPQYLQSLETVRKSGGLDWAVLMITDVIEERSVLLSTVCSVADSLPYQKLGEGIFDMPGVMSRKKQLLPEILHAVDE